MPIVPTMGKGSTPAVEVLVRRGIAFTLHSYEIDDAAGSYGEAVAAAVGIEPERLFKTLVALVDGAPVNAIVPVSGRLSPKKLARAAAGKHAALADPADAQRLTGYVVGGISPIGQRRPIPTYVDLTIAEHDTVYVSAGRRGLQLEIDPDDLLAVTGATLADLAR